MRTATLLLLLLIVGEATAQLPVTVRDINQIPTNQVQQLLDGGPALTFPEIRSLIFNDLVGQEVQFTAVVLSDPLNSGLANLDGIGNPDRLLPAASIGTNSTPDRVLSPKPRVGWATDECTRSGRWGTMVWNEFELA